MMLASRPGNSIRRVRRLSTDGGFEATRERVEDLLAEVFESGSPT